VFVADNDAVSREGSRIVAELAPSYRFPLSSRVVDEPGLSAVRNAILIEAREGRSDFIAMIDDDETGAQNWLVGLLRAQARWGADIVGGPAHFDVQANRSFEGAFWSDPRPSGPTDVLFATNNALVSCAALERLGWPAFDPEFGLTGGEDLEWFSRLSNLGAHFAWSADAWVAEVVSHERLNIGWLFKRQVSIGEAQMRVVRKHGSKRQKSAFLLKSISALTLSPIEILAVSNQQKRFKILRRWARGIGAVRSLVGLRHAEYAKLHVRPPADIGHQLSRDDTARPTSRPKL
jgi:glycosyltransferase involved in cell wall biosynthesis